MLSEFNYSGDQFGYYTVGGTFKTYSKLLAIEEMQRTGIHLEWQFNKEEYSKFDWTKEPTESLDELYRRRAQEIRDKYDYIVLWYSGGPDSWAMLNAFESNNIKIDEIANFISYEAEGEKNTVMNEEIFVTAIPHLEKILEKQKDIKHRVVDISKIISEIYLRPEVKFEYIYNIKGIMSVNSLARSYIREYVDDYKRIMDSGKRMCFLWGAEKPRISRFNGKYHTCFIDVFSETNLRLQSLSGQGYFDEWFYWSPSSAPIVAKQSHMLMNVVKTESTNSGSSWLVDKKWAHSPQSPNGKYLRNDIYHTLIYPGWNPTTVVAPKPLNLLLSERDNWFWKQGMHNDAVRNAHNGITEMIKRVGEYWVNDINDHSRGIKGCINTYALE
jgi:hypothetical protein